MSFSNRAALALVGALLAGSACSGNGTVPASPSGAGNSASQASNVDTNATLPAGDTSAALPAEDTPTDNTSILKKLKKDVVIGSTIDPTNGDTGPHALSVVKVNYLNFKKGQLLVCNFANSAGKGGKGTTIDVFDPKPGSKPTSFAQSSDIEGCDGVAGTSADDVYASGLTSGVVAGFTPAGKLIKTYGSPIEKPFSILDASCSSSPDAIDPAFCGYSAEYIFVSDAKTGSIVSFSINNYGNPKPTQVATGFAANNKTNWSRLGPSGLSYDGKKDMLYIADGKSNTVVVFTNAGELLEKNEIVVLPGGKTFKCKYKKACGKLIYSGSPLDAPVAMTRLPNGNLIVANTKGGNTLVELTPAGQVLDKKVVDTSKTAGIFALQATGKSDTDTVLFYTDTNTNTLHELEQ